MKCWPETVDFYQRVYDEMKYRVEHNMSSVPEEKYRLFWNAIIPWYYIGLYNWLEETFGAVTLNYEYGGGDPIDESIIDYDFPLESIARKMYAKTWWRVSAAENAIRNWDIDFMVRWIEKHDIDGAISLMVASCRATQNLVQNWKLLREKLDIPALGIEADMVDTRTYSDALVKQRLAAFMETVDAAKREREG
jgi:benzoyl-CoA reductase/2-hydroxyglutaryl-CoA dehydratase subunit BcrC/BadD/HgdB